MSRSAGAYQLVVGRPVVAATGRHDDLRPGSPRLPWLRWLVEESAEGGGEPSTIERPRKRARFIDQGELARPFRGAGARRCGGRPGPGTIQCRRPRPGRPGRAVDALRVGGANVGGGAEARPQPRKHKREGGPRNRRMTFGMGVGRPRGVWGFQAAVTIESVRRVRVWCLVTQPRRALVPTEGRRLVLRANGW